MVKFIKFSMIILAVVWLFGEFRTTTRYVRIDRKDHINSSEFVYLAYDVASQESITISNSECNLINKNFSCVQKLDKYIKVSQYYTIKTNWYNIPELVMCENILEVR